MKRGAFVAGSVVCLGLILLSPTAAAEEVFVGRVVNVGGAPTGMSTFDFTLQIDSYSTDEEVVNLAGILANQGPDALRKELWNMEAKGWVKIGNSLGYPVAVFRSNPQEKGRIVRAFSDRPIQMVEAMRGMRSRNYSFGLIELQLDENGRGEGTLLPAAEARFNAGGTIEIVSLGTQTFRILNVKPGKASSKE